MDDQAERSESPTHHSGTGRGEELGSEEAEAGRQDTGTSGAERPRGTGSGRISTGINPDAENPIDPEMPNMPPA